MAVRMPLFPSPRMLIVRRAMVEGLRGDNKVWRVIMLVIVALLSGGETQART